MNRVSLAEAYLTRNAELEAALHTEAERREAAVGRAEEAEREIRVLTFASENRWQRMEAAEAREAHLSELLNEEHREVERLVARETALREALNLALMHLEDERALAAVRAALATLEDAPYDPWKRLKDDALATPEDEAWERRSSQR